MKYLLVSIFIIGFFSCKNEESKTVKITNPERYNAYLAMHDSTYQVALEQKDFWSQRLSEDTTGVGNLGPLAGAYGTLFGTTGNVQYLYDAESLYKKGIENSANNKDAFARGLSHNYISQHRFQEAKQVLEESYAGVSNKKATELMLFDVYMELGEYDKAYEMLEKSKNLSDYNYLIRVAKWSDYKGDLDAAITFIEKARDIANSRKSKPLQLWTYTNLGDYYGHAGRIQDAYGEYLKALKIQPDNAYAKKGIAWIVYSYERDADEAKRILDSISKHHQVPDYHLLRAEIAEWEGDAVKSEQQQEAFLKAVNEGDYGTMYNAYLIEIYAETNPEKALQLAQQEVENRSTPETYHLLALAQLGNGMNAKALATIEQHVSDKTSEPMALYHSALVYQENGMDEKVKAIKEELLEAKFEVGPILFKKIENL